MGRNRLNGAHCRRLAVEGIAYIRRRPVFRVQYYGGPLCEGKFELRSRGRRDLWGNVGAGLAVLGSIDRLAIGSLPFLLGICGAFFCGFSRKYLMLLGLCLKMVDIIDLTIVAIRRCYDVREDVWLRSTEDRVMSGSAICTYLPIASRFARSIPAKNSIQIMLDKRGGLGGKFVKIASAAYCFFKVLVLKSIY